MKVEVASCRVKSLRGATSLTVDGNEYEADKNGEFEIAQEHLTAARSHGFELVDGAEHDGKVEIKATGHNVDDPSAPAAAEVEQSTEEDEEVDYEKLNKSALVDLAVKRDVKIESDANKAAIIKALQTDDHLKAGEYTDVLKEDLVDYAAKRGVDIDAKATKDDIIAALVKKDQE